MKAFDYSLVKDPQYFKDGRMDAHSDHTYYRDGEEAQEKKIPGNKTLLWVCYLPGFFYW